MHSREKEPQIWNAILYGNVSGAFWPVLANDPVSARHLINRLWKCVFDLGLVGLVDDFDSAQFIGRSPKDKYIVREEGTEMPRKLALGAGLQRSMIRQIGPGSSSLETTAQRGRTN